MSRAPKIKTYDGLDQFPVVLPWELPTNASLAVFISFDDGSEEELGSNDFSIENDEVKILKDYECVKAVTIACIPCPELELPKFGKIDNQVIQNAFDQMLDLVSFLEFRLGTKFGRQIGANLNCFDGRVAGFVDGQIVPLDSSDVVFTKMEYTREQEIVCLDSYIGKSRNLARQYSVELELGIEHTDRYFSKLETLTPDEIDLGQCDGMHVEQYSIAGFCKPCKKGEPWTMNIYSQICLQDAA